MNWKIKAKIQNVVAALPDPLSHSIYYWLQRSFGSLRQVNPVNRLTVGIKIYKTIKQFRKNPIGKVFLEIGTGRRINIPIVYWLIGAKKIVTVDLNRYLKEKLVREDMDYIRVNQDEIKQLFDGNLFEDRFQNLISLLSKKWHLNELLELCQINYLAPQDVAALPMQTGSIDFYTSYTVFEHIPVDVLKSILLEGNRVIKKDGFFINKIDYSDHFSHSDQSISSINFLQFSDKAWQVLARNKYMYMNRCREDDFERLFQEAGHRILDIESEKDPGLLQLIKDGRLKLDDKFKEKPDEVIATIASWIVSEKIN